MGRADREADVTELVVNGDGSVLFTIDLPPQEALFLPPSLWPPAITPQYIEWELRRLASRPPIGLRSIRMLDAPPTKWEGRSAAPQPWRVEALINGPEHGPYHCPDGIRLLILIPEGYPAEPADFNFAQTLHHFFLDHDNSLPSIFYELLADIAEGAAMGYSIRDGLKLVYHLLQSPLHPCEGCQKQFDAYAQANRERMEIIELYGVQCCHKQLFDERAGWRLEWLNPALRSALECPGDDALRAVVEEVAEGIYRFPMLTDECCGMLLDELDSYAASGLPVSRPNSMNKYGLVLNEIGMEPVFTSLVEQVLQRIARTFFGEEGECLDRHHSFVVQYAAGKVLQTQTPDLSQLQISLPSAYPRNSDPFTFLLASSLT